MCKVRSSKEHGKIANKQGWVGSPTRTNKCQKCAGMAVLSVWHAAFNTLAAIFMDNQAGKELKKQAQKLVQVDALDFSL